MDAEAALHGDGPDGAEVSDLAESQAANAVEEHSENNVTSHDEGAGTEESGSIACFCVGFEVFLSDSNASLEKCRFATFGIMPIIKLVLK